METIVDAMGLILVTSTEISISGRSRKGPSAAFFKGSRGYKPRSHPSKKGIKLQHSLHFPINSISAAQIISLHFQSFHFNLQSFQLYFQHQNAIHHHPSRRLCCRRHRSSRQDQRQNHSEAQEWHLSVCRRPEVLKDRCEVWRLLLPAATWMYDVRFGRFLQVERWGLFGRFAIGELDRSRIEHFCCWYVVHCCKRW